MESNITANGNSWEIVPTNPAVSIVLAILFFYLFFRHVLFVFMVMDIVLGWLRKFSWFPKEGKRAKTALHWVIALGAFVGFLGIAGAAGWLAFIPQ
ncbi:hypothetical protein [Sulfitobacter donghicola]|uniref:Uncharacterized protein n=1 Tax=Sulfitobacter donghicola DSW-25 = KCTC 12864 = JCM 14565 TaxID=1300350 RepID=A0A073IY77_9RHOB|nr:hypothetical protein [Sulfitobacter donghicola]KEJ90342.1 hypothetical protein DSW25_08825 [Sulfitobacter donghicola DSW-25 = KCTC 12864 = JCM 14565]KIN66542.1 hypothetical protein Z948_242 [Sulfitobacter donghicola DSW-25 = KCTC 12864 = JCM 14565]